MLALEVIFNGERFVLAGVKDWATLHAQIYAIRGNGEELIELDVGARLAQSEPGRYDNLRWGKRELSLNDTVTIRLVDTEHPDDPVKRFRSDATVQESPYTDDEILEMKRATCLRLKRELDPDI